MKELIVFKDFFKRRKYRAVRFGEPVVEWTNGAITPYSVIFFENDNGKRKYTVKGTRCDSFKKTLQFTHCETWVHTGLFPDWAKDPVAEKLSRD